MLSFSRLLVPVSSTFPGPKRHFSSVIRPELNVVSRRNDHRDILPVLRCRPDHRRAPDVNVFNQFLERSILPGSYLLELIQIDHNHVDQPNAMLFSGLHVFRIRPNRQNSAGDHGVDGLDAAVEHLGEACNVGDISNRNGFVSQKGRSSACRDQFDTEVGQSARERGDTGLVCDTEEGASDSGHGKALFLHVPETHMDVRRYTSMEDFAVSRLLSPMILSRFLYSIRGFALGVTIVAQVVGQTAPAGKSTDRSSAYYHYALGHMYAEQAGNKGDYLNRAIENLRLALKADPTATFISEELSDLYVQSGRLREAVQDAEEALRTNPNDLNARRILGRIYTRMIGDSQQGKVNDEMLKKAIEQYTKIVEGEPKDIDTWLMLGRLQKIALNSVESEKAYKKVLEIDPNHEDALTGLAVVYADLGDSQRSSDLLKKLTEKNPSPRTLMALASQYEQMKDYTLAAETLRKALELQPENTDVKRAYAQNLLLADKYDEALAIYNDIAADDPKDWQSQLRISQIYRQKKDFAKAREASKKALAIEPKNLEVQYNEVNILESEGKNTEAIAALKDLLINTAKRSYSAGEKSNRALLLERLGLMHRSSEQFEEAVAVFRQIADLDTTLGARAEAQIIDTYRASKDFQKALQESDAAAKKYPDDKMLLAVRSSVLAEVGRADEAATELKKLLDGKNDRETYISLAQVYEKGKNFTEMAKAVDAAEKLSDSKEEKESILFMRGSMYEKMKKFDAAETEFRKVLEINPKNASALNYLGYMLADRNVRVNDAVGYIKEALEIEPNNPAYLDSLGWAYYRTGDLAQAEEYLRRAVDRFSKDPTVHDHLGDVYFKQGNLKDAITHWQSSIKEWENASPSERDATEVAKVQKKLDSAKVRLARESGERGTAKQH